MGFLSAANLVGSLINFQSLNLHDQFCWISFHYNLTGTGKKEEKMARGAGRGDYSREAIILSFSVRGERLFEGGDQSRDGHYSRKYGNLKRCHILRDVGNQWPKPFHRVKGVSLYDCS